MLIILLGEKQPVVSKRPKVMSNLCKLYHQYKQCISIVVHSIFFLRSMKKAGNAVLGYITPAPMQGSYRLPRERDLGGIMG